MAATLAVAAYVEGYAALLSLPFLVVLGAGLGLSLWLALRFSTARLLGLLTVVFFMEYIDQSVGITSGLWRYHGRGGQYVFGVMAWLAAACSAQMIALGVVIPLLARLHLPPLRRWTWLVVVACFAVIPLAAGASRAEMGVSFWSFFGLIFALALLVALRMSLTTVLGIVLAGIVAGNLSEYVGSALTGCWTFPHDSAYPPLYLVMGCWPLEILAQFGAAAFLAGEPIAERGERPSTIPAISPAADAPAAAYPHRASSREGRELRVFLVLSGLTYLGVGFAFAIVPSPILGLINDFSHWLLPKLPLATLPNDRFWVSLSYSMMMTITGLCWIAALNVRRNRGYVFPLLLAKAASALSSLVLFFAVTHQLASLVIFFVDGSIFWITLFFFVRAQRAFFRQQTGYFYGKLPPAPSSGPAHVVVASGAADQKFQCLDRVLAETGFFELLERQWTASGKARDSFRVVIKPNFMFMHSKLDPSTYTDPELVVWLVDRIAARGFTAIALVESQTTYGNYYLGRDVLSVAEYLGYRADRNYRIVDLTKEMVPYNYGGRLGHHFVGPTWRDADFRISFAKNKTHIFCNYTLTLKNVYGTLPMQNKLCEYHTQREYDWPTIETLKHFPVHFGLVDAYLSGDGQFGVITDPHPNPTNTILGGENLLAVDWVGAKKMGLDPDDPMIGRFLPLAERAFGKPEVHCTDDLSVYPRWKNVSPIFTYALDILEEAYAFSNWWFSVLTAHDARFPFDKKDWPTWLVRKLLAPGKRLFFPHDAL
jgi:uncharacterized protein (DUF362 family)